MVLLNKLLINEVVNTQHNKLRIFSVRIVLGGVAIILLLSQVLDQGDPFVLFFFLFLLLIFGLLAWHTHLPCKFFGIEMFLIVEGLLNSLQSQLFS